MEIKDITVAVESLEEVRGGQYIDASNVGVQLGANSAFSAASGWGVKNATSSLVNQDASQKLAQSNAINAAELDVWKTSIDHSVVGFPFLGRAM